MSQHHTEAFDSQLKQIEFYQKYPEYLPFIGQSYEVHKILFLGESHYFPKESTWHKVPEDWYNGSSDLLVGDEAYYINTRRVVSNIHGEKPATPQKWKKSRTIFRNIERVMLDSGLPKTDNLFCHVAFMNAFQRPADQHGDSIKVRPIDVEQSVQVIRQVIEIIQPKHICFVSSKASKHLAQKIGVNSDVVMHPASAWWNRLTKQGSTGKADLIKLLAQYIASNH